MHEFDFGTHKSSAKSILGCSVLRFTSDRGRPIDICHIIADGFSTWVLARNITRVCDILNVGKNCLLFPPSCGCAHVILSILSPTKIIAMLRSS